MVGGLLGLVGTLPPAFVLERVCFSLLGVEGCSSKEEHSLSVLTDSFLLSLSPDGMRLGGGGRWLGGGAIPTDPMSVLNLEIF